MNLTKLEELAKAATPGPWLVHEPVVYLGRQGGFDLRDCPLPKENSKYIAAANPETILKMIQVMRQMGNVLENSRIFVTSRERIKHPEGTAWFDEALAAFKELENGS